MKKFKKLISMVCSLAMVASFAVMPNTANAENIVSETLLEKSLALNNLKGDYEYYVPNQGSVYSFTDGQVVKAWGGTFSIAAWDLTKPISGTDAGTYNIEFDFCGTSPYGVITLDDTDIVYDQAWEVANSTYKTGFKLVAPNTLENMKVGDTFTDIIIKDKVWYSYEMELDLATKTVDVSIVERDNAEAVASTYTGSLTGWDKNKTYDSLRVSTNGTTTINNIKVSTVYDADEFLAVSSADRTTTGTFRSYYDPRGSVYCNADTNHIAKIFDWEGHLATGGWNLARTISGADAKTYQVKFDFNVTQSIHYTTAMLGLEGETCAGWSSSPAMYNSGYKFLQVSPTDAVNGTTYTIGWGDGVYNENTWYSMTTYISPETGYERKIVTERETGAVVADTGWVALNTTATGWVSANTYDKLRFTTNYSAELEISGDMYIDNASVRAVDFPVATVSGVTALADGVAQNCANTFTNAVKVEFTKPVEKEAVEASGVVTLTNEKGNVAFTFGEWSEDNTSVVLNLAKAFEDDTTYTLTVKKDAGLLEDATYTLAVDNTLLEADIDNTNPTPYQEFPSGEPRWWTVSEENGNKFMNLVGIGYYAAGWGGPTWGAVGYMFARPMSADNDYTMDFDFRMNALNGYDGFVISNTDATSTWTDRTTLITGSPLAPLSDIGTFEGNIEWSAEKWYSYHAELTDGNVWNVTVTDKADSSKTATLSGTAAYDTFDRISVVASADIDLDNISIEEKGAEAPAVVSVDFGGATLPPFMAISQMPVFSMGLSATNTTDENAAGFFLIAYYAGNKFIGVDKADFTVMAGTEAGTVNVTVPMTSEYKAQADKVTFMIIDGFTTFMPYCGAVSVSK